MRLHLASLLHDIIDLLLLEILSLYWSEIKSDENYSENSLFADTVRDTNLENVVSYFIVFSNFSNVSAHYYFIFFEMNFIVWSMLLSKSNKMYWRIYATQYSSP